MSEEPAETEAERLFKKHLGFMLELEDEEGGYIGINEYIGDSNVVDWKEFMEDLQRCPAIARVTGGVSDFPALHYVVLLSDLPIEVLRELLRIYPGALHEREVDFGWNIMQWIQWGRGWNPQYKVAPEVLRVILTEAPEFAVEEKVEENLSPVYDWILRDPESEQVKAILETSREATAFVLSKHFAASYAERQRFQDDYTVPEKLLEFALNCALQWESEGEDVFSLSLDIDTRPDETENFTLANQLFEHLESKRIKLFHRYLKIFVSGKEAYLAERAAPRVDKKSLTCCVLYMLAKCSGENDKMDKREWWQKYLDVCRNKVTKPSQTGDVPLYTAIRLGYQWNPVICFIVNEDPSVLEKPDSEEKLSPFALAAATTATQSQDYCSELGDYNRLDYTNLNTVNNTYQLLRANPNALVPSKPKSKQAPPPSSLDTKRAAKKSSTPESAAGKMENKDSSSESQLLFEASSLPVGSTSLLRTATGRAQTGQRTKLIAVKSVMSSLKKKKKKSEKRSEEHARAEVEEKKPPKKKVRRSNVVRSQATGTAETARTPPKDAKKAAKKSPAKAKTTVVKASPRIRAEEVFSGIPNDKNVDWSWEGWTKKSFRRMSGKTKGGRYSYWYTPQKNYKLRSLAECRRFNQALKLHNGDEENAWRSFNEVK
jgi:hypothetical protein